MFNFAAQASPGNEIRWVNNHQRHVPWYIMAELTGLAKYARIGVI